jgi:rubrerythrin
MVDVNVLERALCECWAAEVSGVSYYETLGERFPEQRQEFDALALVEKTTRDLIEAVARKYGVSIDQGEAECIGVQAAQLGNNWREVLESALEYTPDTLRMFMNLADVLPEEESALGRAVVEHERAQIVLFECAATGRANDWSAIDAFLEQQGARPHS